MTVQLGAAVKVETCHPAERGSHRLEVPSGPGLFSKFFTGAAIRKAAGRPAGKD